MSFQMYKTANRR